MTSRSGCSLGSSELLQSGLAALLWMMWGRSAEEQETWQAAPSESCNHDPCKRLGWPGPDNSQGNGERVEELVGSFEAPATLVAATSGHQAAIPIIREISLRP